MGMRDRHALFGRQFGSYGDVHLAGIHTRRGVLSTIGLARNHPMHRQFFHFHNVALTMQFSDAITG